MAVRNSLGQFIKRSRRRRMRRNPTRVPMRRTSKGRFLRRAYTSRGRQLSLLGTSTVRRYKPTGTALRAKPRAKVRKRRRTSARRAVMGGGKCFGVLRRRPVRKHLKARKSISAGRRVAGLTVINPYLGGAMPAAVVVNPRRRRRRKSSSRSVSVTGRRVKRRRTRRNPGRGGALMARNPGVVGAFKGAFPALLGGGVGGVMAGFLDTKMLHDKPTLSVLSKLGLGVMGGLVLRKRPALAAGFAGGMMGSLGYSFATKLGGGMVAPSKGAALKGLSDMAADDPELAALITDGTLEDLVDGSELGDSVDDYAASLQGDDDEGS